MSSPIEGRPGMYPIHDRPRADSSLVELPEHYRRRLGGQQKMPRSDLLFIDTLFTTYGIAPNRDPQNEGSNDVFDRGMLFSAAREMSMKLGAIKHEPEISSQRVEDLSYLFLHYPPVKRQVDKLHVETFTEALPGFKEQLGLSIFKPYNVLERMLDDIADEPIQHPPSIIRKRYINHAHSIMSRQLSNAAWKLYVTDDAWMDIENLGSILANSLPGANAHEDFNKLSGTEAFAVIGTQKFITVLGAVVDEGVENGEDLQAKVDFEFLTREGAPFTLMRTSLRGAHALNHGDSLPEMRQALSQAGKNRDRGRCPAIINRIAHQYATVILENIPASTLVKD